eukprot:TRINITY_DN6018_c1_g1_i1.p1 TRINITY_DN6018_c1_g1~~TRINITY_DN6018_c1_g1_i1.p1  ORF type:complete len:157 (+),score=21.96 TRINITY_DN6018_c1_g1_i1:199-669(+)
MSPSGNVMRLGNVHDALMAYYHQGHAAEFVLIQPSVVLAPMYVGSREPRELSAAEQRDPDRSFTSPSPSASSHTWSRGVFAVLLLDAPGSVGLPKALTASACGKRWLSTALTDSCDQGATESEEPSQVGRSMLSKENVFQEESLLELLECLLIAAT